MAEEKIPEWILQCLDQYGNCACGRAITVKMGKDKLLKTLEDLGYPCDLEIISDDKEEEYPKDGTYILTSKSHEVMLDSTDYEDN